nr:winged helix DNA-binding domain-containing protein [Phytoactinopolyspora mesophila]
MHAVGLAGGPWESAEDVVRRLSVVQSQDLGPAMWSVGQRLADASEDAIAAALADGSIVRTHVLRPTWHFVLPEDIRWLLDLTAPRVHAFNAYYYRTHELDRPLLDRCADLIGTHLSGGNALTRREVATVLEHAGVPASSLRLGLILMYAELQQIICNGPRRGKQSTYALFDERVPAARRLDHDEALAELTRRYFTSHGPATAKDFQWWSSLTMADISKGLDVVAGGLESRHIGGRTYYWAPSAQPVPGPAPHVAQLLQPYDEYVVAYTESKVVLDRAGLDASKRPERGAYNGIILLGTQMVGNWKRAVKRHEITVDVQLYRPLDATETESLHVAAHAHAAFLGKAAASVNPPQQL